MYSHMSGDSRVNVTSGHVSNLQQGQHLVMNGNVPAMQQTIVQQQQQQLQHHFHQQLMQHHQQQQSHPVLAPPSVFPQAPISNGQQFINFHQPVQVFANNTKWPDHMEPIPVTSQQPALPVELVPLNSVSSSSTMKTISSQGMLLPLVNMPEDPYESSASDENPKEQMQECMNVIEEALLDPSLADAGKMLLKAMRASSSYMSEILEAKRTSPLPLKPSPACGGSDKRFFLDSSILSRNPIQKPPEQQSMEQTFSSHVQPNISQKDQLPPVPTPITSSLSSSSPLPSSSLPAPPTQTVSKKPVTNGGKPVVHKASCGQLDRGYKPTPLRTAFQGSPHAFLVTILKERGYSTQRTSSQDAGYHTEPTALQVASFGTCVVQAVHRSDTNLLSQLLGAGLSPNPCNQFGDSILSLICKRADYGVFKVMVDHGCELQVCDSFGRTCLHSLAWAGKFSALMAKAILDSDLNQVLIEDKHGQCPMEYVRKEKWNEWITFLRDNMDVYWPVSHHRQTRALPRDTRFGSVLADPVSAVPPEVAVKLSAGEITPEEASKQKEPKVSNNFDLLF